LAIFTSPVHRVEFLGPLTANSISRINELSFQTGIPYWDWSKMYFNSPDSVFADSFTPTIGVPMKLPGLLPIAF